VEDSNFDLEYHVRHIALPKPGDWRHLCIQAARLHSRPLDLTKPLWEMYVIEGLDNVEGLPPGSFAVLTKIHHAAIDGVSGASCREMMPDPAFYAHCLQDSFDELRDASLRGRRRVRRPVKGPASGETAPARATRARPEGLGRAPAPPGGLVEAAGLEAAIRA
jgi:Wax ester synthase-like Acyl-CoA acyltransferase domain